MSASAAPFDLAGPAGAVFAATAVLAWVLTGIVLRHLRRRAILDLPNERSSHTRPTPRGGGWGVMLTLLPAWAAIAWTAGAGLLPLLAGAALLMAVSWIDDLRGLGAPLRFLAQTAAVAAGIAVLPSGELVFQGWLPPALDRAAAGFCWLWFVNLFNFMDGIDGIAGSEAAAIGLGLAAVAALAGLPPVLVWLGAAAAGAAVGFLVWNWHPAKLFMGDVGSVPLGYLLGWLLLALAGSGAWPAALLLPLYFLADATVTLLRRLARGERVWQAHREHFYQQAVQAGRSHAAVVRAVIVANAVLIALAVLSVRFGWVMVIPGAVVVIGLLFLLAQGLRPFERARG
ncbi:MAG: glycosyl transferase [Candidatus Hydrogenedens sp.]|nr:glycosyl transferase [Candidatus Hydrogenedens sp.]